MTNNKNATFDELIADSQPEQRQVNIGDHVVLVQELPGAARFELAERAQEGKRWDLLCWVCMQGMIDPKPNKMSYLDKMKPEWVVKIATAITDLSGVSEEALDEAGEESAGGNAIGGS